MSAITRSQPRSALWRDRDFRSFWGAQTVSAFGDQVSALALPLIAVRSLDASVNQVAWLTALIWTPYLLAPAGRRLGRPSRGASAG